MATMAKKAKKPTRLELSPQQQQHVNNGILSAAKKWDIDIDESTQFTYDCDAHLTGNKKLAASSLKSYVAEHGKGLWHFLARIGDHESMLMLVTPILDNVPAMKDTSLMAYMRYKKNTKGTVCTATEAGAPLRDAITNDVIECTGTWKCNSRVKQFAAAISRFHVARGHVSDYYDVCDVCVQALEKDTASRGCRVHHGRESRVYRRGNVTKSVDFLDIKQALIDHTYHEKGCDGMGPKDIRMIGTYLLAGSSVAALSVFCLILIAIRLFCVPTKCSA